MSDKNNFVKWLSNKLRELNTDESVFGEYILSILEGDESIEEKRESLEGILSAIIENDLDKIIDEITAEWEKCAPSKETESKEMVDVDAKLAKLLENKHIATTVQREYTEEEKRIREQILSQYSQVEYDDGYEEEVEDGAGTSVSSGAPLTKNTNAADVAQLAKERREQAKIDSKAKKDKDKEDREKQKQQREEKKEKRKTVKGERRR